MPISGEQPDLAALPPESSPVKRRLAAQYVREARDRLTSSSGTRPAFDYELLRRYAQNRLSASLVILLLVATVDFMSGIWSGALAAGAWTAAVLVIHVVMIAKCRQFLERQMSEISARAWRLRFVVLDLFYGLAWMLLLIHPVGADESSSTFMLFVMLLVVAVSSMLASSLSTAVFAVATLEARAEKDALIGELEQAKAISDEARRRAEAANIAKSRFLAQMSHKLRTPLNAILGFSEVMKTEIFGAHVVPAYKEYSSDIHSSGVHLLGLINEILDLSRIEAGRYELNEKSVSLVAAVEDCHHLPKLRARNRSIVIHEIFEPGLPRLWADERAIRQICLNLLSNAIKFAPQTGEIWLKVGWTASGGQNISVKDTGAGISGEEIPVVLASFGQGLNPIKSAEQGGGLGLPIAKSLVDPSRRHVHFEIEVTHWHRGYRHISAGAGCRGNCTNGRTCASDRVGH
jgi:two-component system, cell cycle sensor histidine kinase PleC